jgi:hypothetical protein
MNDGQRTICTAYKITCIEISDASYPFDKKHEVKHGDGKIVNITSVQNKDVIYFADDFCLMVMKE